MRSLDNYFISEKMKQVYDYYSISSEDRTVIKNIVNLEWEFFDKVKGLNGRAICQDESLMFLIMRLSQHLLFSNETRFSILKDYEIMLENGINPIEGKYARMMMFTDVDLYKSFLDKLPGVSPIKRQVIVDLIKVFEKDLLRLEEKLPVTMSHSRPQDGNNKSVSSLEYFYAELTFFSYRTLRRMKMDLSDEKMRNCVERIMQNTIIINKFLT